MENQSDDEQTIKMSTKDYFPCGFKSEAKILMKITVPFALGNILSSWLISFISLAFLGHARGQIELNAGALALSTYILIANSLMLGLNFGCDTLLPQCFGGNKRKMGLVVQRALLITGYSCLISWTLILNAKFALKWIEHDRQVVQLTDLCLRLLLPAVVFDGISMLLQKYIASNEKTFPLLIINLIGNGTNILLNYLFLYQFHWDIRSLPISMTISYSVNCLCAVIYIRFSSIFTETWHPIDRNCLSEWNVYLKLSIPGVLMIMTEFWSIELSMFFAAHLSARSLSAQICAYQTAWFLYLITSSFATAANIRIGQYLGAGKPLEAKNTKNVTYAVGSLVIFLNMILIVITHHWFPLAYDTQTDALPMARRVLLLIGLLQIWDGYNVINTGIVKACGQQKRGAFVALIGFYLFGIPTAFILMFICRFDIFGFWIGIIVAETVTNTFLFILVQRFHWESHSNKALKRILLNSTNIQTENPVSSDDIEFESDKKPISWSELLRVKILIFCVFVIFFIFGIFTSKKLTLYS